MVCQPCREAGSLLRLVKLSADNPGMFSIPHQGVQVYFEQQAILLHKECQGGTWCDCQHFTS